MADARLKNIAQQLAAAALAGTDFVEIDGGSTGTSSAKVLISELALLLETLVDHGSLQGLSDDDHTQYTLISSQAGVPSTTPSRVGLLNVDTTNDRIYVSTDVVSSADWDILVFPSSTDTLINKTLNDFTNSVDADKVHIQMRNESGGAMAVGDAVYISGFSVGQALPLASFADSSASGTMPVAGILESATLANNANGDFIESGRVENMDTSAWSAGDMLYASETGTTGNTLTNVKPQGTALIQTVAIVLRSHASSGVIEVVGAGRTNDLPNIANTKIWIGDANGVPQEFTLSGDVTNDAGGVVTVSSSVVKIAGTQTLTNKTIDSFTNTVHADHVHFEMRNESGGAMAVGDAVYISGYSVGQDLPLGDFADASAAGTMPCIAILADATLANNANGQFCQSGTVPNMDTSSWSVGDALYISETGTTGNTLQNTKPQGTALIQRVGIVLRSHATLGVIEIINMGRENDIPNIPNTKIWIGDSNGVAQEFAMSGDATMTAGGVVTLAAGVNVKGKQTIWIPAAAMRPTVSNGCAALTDAETTAGRPDMTVLDFDASADEHAQFQVAFPKQWNLGTVTFQLFWTTAGAVTTGIAFGLQGVAVTDNGTIDVAYGTAIVVTDDAQSAAEELYVSAESAAITIAGTPADDDMCYFRIFRDISDANDDMTQDARLIGIKLFYTIDAATDA